MKRYLVLENGSVWEGEAFGADGEVIAELVCTTQSEYTQILSDGSFAGQAVVQAFPMLGNYGAIYEDIRPAEDNGAPRCAAYIVRDACAEPSNFRSQGTVDEMFKKLGVVGLCGIDTRALCRVLRQQGSMNAMITSDPSRADIKAIGSYKTPTAFKLARDNGAYTVQSVGERRFQVVAVDMAGETGEIAALAQRGCEVRVLPCTATAEEICALKPDGVLITGGPGDARECTPAIETVRSLMSAKVPMLGIGMGHQIMALAAGFDTAEMKNGHRGTGQPVRNTESGAIYIQLQNHGYEVAAESIAAEKARVLFTCVNDGGIEGLEYIGANAVSVQFRPDTDVSKAGTGFVYDMFIALMSARTEG